MTEPTHPRPRPRPTTAAPAGPPPQTAAAAGRPRARLLFVAVAAGVLVLALIGLNVWLWTVRADNSDVEQARHDALASARQRVPAMLSYDYRKIDSYARSAPQNATGRFKSDFTSLVKRIIAPAAVQQQITTKATVKQAGIVDASADQVTVLVLLDQTTTSKTSKKGRLDGSRDRVIMRKVDGTWLVAALDPV